MTTLAPSAAAPRRVRARRASSRKDLRPWVQPLALAACSFHAFARACPPAVARGACGSAERATESVAASFRRKIRTHAAAAKQAQHTRHIHCRTRHDRLLLAVLLCSACHARRISAHTLRAKRPLLSMHCSPCSLRICARPRRRQQQRIRALFAPQHAGEITLGPHAHTGGPSAGRESN